MISRFAGDFGPDTGVDASVGASGITDVPVPVLDSLGGIDAGEATPEVEPEEAILQLLRARRPRPRAVKCRRGARRPASAPEPPADVDASDASPILSESSFVRLLQLEKRRADRSHGPLSLMLFRVDAGGPPRAATIASFARRLQARKRETDYLARLAEDVFALLLPETTADGTRQFNQRLRSSWGICYSSRSATYPDDRLEPLLEEYDRLPAFATHEHVDGSIRATGGYALKRTIDVVGAFVLLLLAAPILFATAVAIRYASPGPVIFRQLRLGKGGVPFVFFKFRSMRVGAPEDAHRNYVEDLIKGRLVSESTQAQDRLAYKMNGDPRITRIGRWIRRTSIDELPQLWNVLRGDMSLVGPRPPIPYEAENYQSWHLRRVLEVKPGITGLWQVAGRSRVSFDDMVRMDIQYAQNCSLWLDLRILARTAWVVLRCEGAG